MIINAAMRALNCCTKPRAASKAAFFSPETLVTPKLALSLHHPRQHGHCCRAASVENCHWVRLPGISEWAPAASFAPPPSPRRAAVPPVNACYPLWPPDDAILGHVLHGVDSKTAKAKATMRTKKKKMMMMK